jgi:hypothetical protein
VTGTEDDIDSFQLYPNPVVNKLELRMPGAGEWTLDLLDLRGQQLLSRSVNGSQTTLNLEYLANGTYILLLQNESRQFRRLLVKE